MIASQANQYMIMVGKELDEQHLFGEEGYWVASTTKGSWIGRRGISWWASYMLWLKEK